MSLSKKILHFQDLLSQQNFASFFYEVAHFVIEIVSDNKFTYKVFESQTLDRLCLEAGQALFKQNVDTTRLTSTYQDCSVYLATELPLTFGGHTLALRDIIRTNKNQQHYVLISNSSNIAHFDDEYCRKLSSEFGENVQVIVVPMMDYDKKFFWLLEKLLQIRPERLYLFNHHFDSILIGLAQPEIAKEILFFHHGDHNLCLGVHIPYARHIDCSELSFQQCRHRFGVKHNIFWPLVSADKGHLSEDHIFMENGEFTTASHGSFLKFRNSNLPDSYADLIVARLQHVVGRHLHLGALDPEITNEVLSKINAAHIDPSRFVMSGYVPSLWQWLLENKIDLCISSYPTQGLKGLVETMGAGIPILMHRSHFSGFYSLPEFAYQGVLEWNILEEFVAQLRRCTPELLTTHSKKSRWCYEQYHRPKLLEMCVTDLDFQAPQKTLIPFIEDSLGQWYNQ